MEKSKERHKRIGESKQSAAAYLDAACLAVLTAPARLTLQLVSTFFSMVVYG